MSTSSYSESPSTQSSLNLIPDQKKVARKPDAFAVTVRWARVLVVVFLVISALIVGALAYYVVDENEQDDFENRVRIRRLSSL
jgi:hypothetical protein